MTTLVPDRPTVSRCSFTSVDPDAVRRLLGDGSELGVEIRRGPAVRLRETRLDTGDRRFERAGYRLVVREAETRRELVLEPARRPSGRRVLRVHAPWSGGPFEATPETCPEPLVEPVRAVVGRRRLRPVERTSSVQETWQLLRDDHLVGTVTLKQVSPDPAAGAAAGAPARVEIEMDDREAGADGVLDRLEARLALSPAGPGTDDAGGNPASGKRSARVRRGTVQHVAFAALRKHFARATAREPGARLGADPEELHDLRVAIRRLRAALRLYRDHLPGKARRFGRELKRIGAALGDVRDLDVQIEWLRDHAGELPHRERQA
ncbi:MAG TPA: CHAD domain-containing protein, partial [bacterium]|nr:CHAD domain-containing protein [bacterium]